LEVDPAEQPDRRLVVDHEHLRHEWFIRRRRLYPSALRATRERQPEAAARAVSLLRRHPDPPAHRGDETLCDEEPETRPRRRHQPAARFAAAVELAKDPLLLDLRDAGPLVDDAHLDRLLLLRRADGDRAALRRVLDRIVDEDREDLPQLVAVRLSGERLVWKVEHELVPVAVDAGAGHDLRGEGADGGGCGAP